MTSAQLNLWCSHLLEMEKSIFPSWSKPNLFRFRFSAFPCTTRHVFHGPTYTISLERNFKREKNSFSMQCCGGEADAKSTETSRQIDKSLRSEKRNTSKKIKLLLLGNFFHCFDPALNTKMVSPLYSSFFLKI
jgi:hypothetical protein